ncbi:MAG: hypothetical protein CME38_13110 [Haliea sp.]|nr:hypothetical protein [Haliea sp.]
MRGEANDPVHAFAAAIARDTGVNVDPTGDGELRRFDCPEGKRSNRAYWYVLLYLERWPAGVNGNWRTESPTLCEPSAAAAMTENKAPTLPPPSTPHGANESVSKPRPGANARDSAARRAQRLWSDATPATSDHPYLARKRIPALCLRQHGHCFALFGRELPEAGKLHIAESWATAATIATTLRLPVVAAINAGNLAPVAQAIRAAHPELSLTVVADDQQGPNQAGHHSRPSSLSAAT